MGYRYNKLSKQISKCSNTSNDCLDQYKECVNNQNKTCDCCCVQGIKNTLQALKNQTVRIDTQTRSYVGVISSVTCDIVSLGASTGTVGTTISICKIEAIIPAVTTITTEFNLGDTPIANKA